MCVGNIPKGFTLAMHTDTHLHLLNLHSYIHTSLSKWNRETMYRRTDGLDLAGPNDMYVLWTKYMFVWLLECCRGVHTRFLAACANGFDHRCI